MFEIQIKEDGREVARVHNNSFSRCLCLLLAVIRDKMGCDLTLVDKRVYDCLISKGVESGSVKLESENRGA